MAAMNKVVFHFLKIMGFLLLTCGLLACRREVIEEKIPVPGYGEPTWNPLYVLRESLIAEGIAAQSRRTLDLAEMKLQPHDTLVFMGDVRELSRKQQTELLRWVQSGGHLIMEAPQWQPLPFNAVLLQHIGLTSSDNYSRCYTYNGEYLLCSAQRFTIDNPSQAEVYWTDTADNAAVWARIPQGKGRIDILGSLDFMNNGLGRGNLWPGFGLHNKTHRLLTRQVLAPNYGRGTIHLVFARNVPSLWKQLAQRGWPVWLPWLLALVAGLWMGSQRFGSLLPAPVAQRRSLLEHVRASGHYLYRYHQAQPLYQAIRASFMQHLKRRTPWLALQSGEAQIAAIARHLQRPSQQVRYALSTPDTDDKFGFYERIRLLIDMRNHL